MMPVLPAGIGPELKVPGSVMNVPRSDDRAACGVTVPVAYDFPQSWIFTRLCATAVFFGAGHGEPGVVDVPTTASEISNMRDVSERPPGAEPVARLTRFERLNFGAVERP